MGKGKSYGADRIYQQLCQDIIRQLQEHQRLVPFDGDGIDIGFQIFGTTVTFDVVLKDDMGNLTVIESKRYADRAIEQRDVFAFWGEIEGLRRTRGVGVKGIFITKSSYRIGAIKAATELDIDVAVCEQDQTFQNFVIAYHRYDPAHSGRVNGVVVRAFVTRTAFVTVNGHLGMNVIRLIQKGINKALGKE